MDGLDEKKNQSQLLENAVSEIGSLGTGSMGTAPAQKNFVLKRDKNKDPCMDPCFGQLFRMFWVAFRKSIKTDEPESA